MSKFPLQEQETLSLKPVGLYTYPNSFSAVPQGALGTAKNIILSRPNVAEPRRGINNIGPIFTADVNKLYSYQDHILASYSNKLSYYSSNLSTRTDYSGTFTPPSNAIKIHSVEANKNFYITTNNGIKKLDIFNGSFVPSGAPTGLDGSGTTTGTGWFVDQTQVAYRVVFSYTDLNQNLIMGAPSQRFVVSNNTGVDTNVSLTFTLPDGLTTSWQYQIYRSPMSVDLTTEPNDELALVYTGNPTAGELAVKVVTVIDSIDDSLKGAFLYTDSSQEGISQANYQPPQATDVAVFKGFTFYANIKQKQQFFITLVSIGAPTGLQVGDQLLIDGNPFTAAVAENILTAEFELFTGGTPSQNITNTANSLVRVINRYLGNTTTYAYYKSGYADLPGQILIAERNINGPTFLVSCSRSLAFVPDLSTPTSSTADSAPNQVAISKFQQPEAVPLGQTIPVGSADKSILRIIALRDYLLIFKEDGVYQIVGTDINSFAEQEVDKTTILQGIETAVSLNNKVFCFSNQTIITMTFNEGAILKALPIKKDLLVISSSLYPNFSTISYGISYESENQYIFGTVKLPTDTMVTQFYVYNYLTDTWTTWEFPYSMGTGFVNPADDKLYFGSTDSASRYLYQERKNFDVTDYADNSYDVTITSHSGLTVHVNSTANLLEGYTFVQGTRVVLITEVVDATTITVNSLQTWVDATGATGYKPIPISIRMIQESCGNPGLVKHFKEGHGIFSDCQFNSFSFGFATDFYTNYDFTTLVPKVTDGFGDGPWGETPFGEGTATTKVLRTYIPLLQRRGHWISIAIDYAQAWTTFAWDGFALFYQSNAQKFH